MGNTDPHENGDAAPPQSLEGYCDSIVANIGLMRSKAHSRKRGPGRNWSPSANGALCTMERLRILVEISARSPLSGPRQLADKLFEHPNFKKLHIKTRGFDSQPWTADTIYRWLTDANSSPESQPAELMMEVLAEIVEQQLRGEGRSSAVSVLEALNRPHNSISRCIVEVLGGLSPPRDRTHNPHPDMRSWISDSLKVEMKAVDPPEINNSDLIEEADKVSKFLATGRPVVHIAVLQSPPSTGRKMVVRRLVSQLTESDEFFKFELGRLPVLACALDEMSPEEFVDAALEFYSPRIPAVQNADIDTKINLIKSGAKREAACVCISDLPPAYIGGLIRGAAQDYIGEVLFAILEGNPLTRIFLTTTSGNHAVLHEITQRGIVVRDFKINPTVRIRRVSAASEAESDYITVPRINARLLSIAKKLIEAAPTEQQSGFRSVCRKLEPKQEAGELITFIWGSLFTNKQRLIVGLCALNRDGLSLVNLMRLLDVGAGLNPAFWEGPALSGQDLVSLIRSTGRLLQVRPEGDVPAESKYVILDDGWRRDFLKHYCTSLPEQSSLAYWLVARLAAEEGRAIRIATDARESNAADLNRTERIITALAASVRSKDLEPWNELPKYRADLLETIVLPPLSARKAEKPHPTLIFRFAFAQVLARDAQKASAGRFSIRDHADRHLEVLLAFFTPCEPWRTWNELVLDADTQSFQQLETALTGEELTELLNELGEAALKSRRFGILSAAARIAENAQQRNGLPQSELMRVHRSEIDGGLLLSAMPRAVADAPPEDSQLTGVIRAIDRLIDKRFKRQIEEPYSEAARASGKFYGRLAEAHLIAGNLELANTALNVAREIEDGFLSKVPIGQQMSPVLSYRGIRCQIKLLLAPAQRARWTKGARKIACGRKLSLPEPVRVDDETLEAARNLHFSNIRRFNSKGITARLASRIDEALLYSAEGQFGTALIRLDISGSTWHGVSTEVALELHATRLRIALDAILMLKRSGRMEDMQALEELAERRRNRGFVTSGDPNASSLEGILVTGAERDASALRNYTSFDIDGERIEFPPFSIQAQLMTCWLSLLTLPDDKENAAMVMRRVSAAVEAQRQHIDEAGCGGLRPEAEGLARILAAALA